MADPADVLAEAARTIREAVRENKRAASAHRREAGRLMGRLAEIRRECDRLGIDLYITEASRKESQSDPSP